LGRDWFIYVLGAGLELERKEEAAEKEMLSPLLVELLIILAGLIIWLAFWFLFEYMLRHYHVIRDEEKEEE
jgi:hypothetical protein